MAQPLTDAINALTRYANTVTGASDTTLSDAVASLASGYGQGGFKCETGTFTVDEDTKGNTAIHVPHQLGEVPDIIVIWTDDLNGLTADNPSPYTTTTIIGGAFFKSIVELPQSLSSTQSAEAAQVLWTVGASGYRMGYTFTSASYGFNGSITSSSFQLPKNTASTWWRAGITYKYFVATKFW